MAKIMVYDPDTNQIYTEWREENDPMPYSYGRTLLVREFRGSSRSTVFWTTTWLYVNMLQSLLPMMVVLPLFNRAFYHATGRVWLGPIVTTTIFALMALGGSVAYIPMF